jgi:hypothetical protein
MDDSRKKPRLVFWAIIALAMPVLYVVSFGPWCWTMSRWGVDRDGNFSCGIYMPLVRIWCEYPINSRGKYLRWYGNLLADRKIDPSMLVDTRVKLRKLMLNARP